MCFIAINCLGTLFALWPVFLQLDYGQFGESDTTKYLMLYRGTKAANYRRFLLALAILMHNSRIPQKKEKKKESSWGVEGGGE